MDEVGKQFLANVNDFLDVPNGRQRLQNAFGKLTQTVIRLFNGYINRQNRNPETPFFDYKREFKSPRAVSDLREIIKTDYQMALDSKLALPFSDVWKQSESEV